MGYTLPPREGNKFWPMPRNYGSLRGSVQQERRLELLTGWYDPDDAGKLMSDPEVYLAALHFFVERYVKKAKRFKHLYHRPDSKHKKAMQEMFTNPRSAMVAPRGGSKTFTVCLEMAPFLAITRPDTDIIIGSETKDLTVDKIKAIRRRCELNERVLQDFGQVWPTGRKGGLDWSNSCLDFVNGSSITGSSIDMATRGRHPMVGLIDDPEGKRSRNAVWRARFMEWLFHDYLNQFDDFGTHVMWIGTILREDSCLWRAIHNEDDEGRFGNWVRRILKMVYEEPEGSGNLVSAWPEKLSVEDFERKKGGDPTTQDDSDGGVTVVGLAAVMAEFQGAPIPIGQRMFHREERKHGYVMCENDGGERFLYDPASRRAIDFDELRAESFIFGGVDVADTPSREADPSAIVIALLDPDGTFWILDALEKHCFSDDTAKEAMYMSDYWRVGVLAWEEVGLAKRIFREVVKLKKQREDEGHWVPQLQGIDTQGVPKEQRIERMRPTFEHGDIKLPLQRPIDGYKPAKHRNRRSIQKLIDQFDTMTGEGTAGHDDLLDATEMIHRCARRRPRRAAFVSDGKRILQNWENKGVYVDPRDADPRNWTKRMQREAQDRMRTKIPANGGFCDAFL
jgi:hypothetical protein